MLLADSETMRRGLVAAAQAGASHVTAGNYGGKLGPYHFHLRRIMSGDLDDAPKAGSPAPAAQP